MGQNVPMIIYSNEGSYRLCITYCMMGINPSVLYQPIVSSILNHIIWPDPMHTFNFIVHMHRHLYELVWQYLNRMAVVVPSHW